MALPSFFLLFAWSKDPEDVIVGTVYNIVNEFQRVKKNEMVLEQRPFVDSTTVSRRVCITDGRYVFSKKR